MTNNEIDTYIATNIMGWKRKTLGELHSEYFKDSKTLDCFWYSDVEPQPNERAEASEDYYCPEAAWSPSTNIKEAFQAADKVYLFNTWELHKDNDNWVIGFGSDGAYFTSHYENESLPMVICMTILGVYDKNKIQKSQGRKYISK